MLVYCLGMTALAAAENGLDPKLVRFFIKLKLFKVNLYKFGKIIQKVFFQQELQLSSKLENLLNGMVEDNFLRRYNVNEIIQVLVNFFL